MSTIILKYHELILKDLSLSLYFSLVVSSFFNHTEGLEHRVSIEGKSPYNEYHIVDSRRKIFPSNLMTFWATIWHA